MDVLRHLGADTIGSALAIDDGSGTVHFLAARVKQPNYLKFCNDPFTTVRDRVSTIRQYTEHKTQLFAKVNLGLAADASSLAEHGDFIKQLRGSILASPLLEHDILFRGVDLSPKEIAQMEKLGKTGFYVPSFTSTSGERSKAYAKSAQLVITVAPDTRQACSVTPELSRYHSEEQETLIACYSAFRLQRYEKVGKTDVLSLYLDDFLSCQDAI